MLVNLKATIMARRVRQADLAIQIKRSAGYLSELIAGRVKPEPHIRTRIAEILNADEAWLFSTSFHVPQRNPDKEGTTAPSSELDPAILRA